MNNQLDVHIVQTPEWGEFKTKMGTPSVRVGDIQFTKHSIPFTPYYVGYAPKVNFDLQKFSWNELKAAAKDEKCAVIRFDIPNVLKGDSSKRLEDKLKENCKRSPRDTFTKWNIFIDLNKSEEEIIAQLEQKTRYNSRLAARKGVVVSLENNSKGLKTFLTLHNATAKRQGFLTHSDKYFTEAFETLSKHNKANILVAEYNDQPLAAWMLFNNQNTIYYTYGGSSNDHKDLMASNLIAYEAIKLGKRLGCKTFDMWGATNDKNNDYWGFTKFKLGYGGELVEHIDSYDFVINPLIYHFFNFSYSLFWKFKKLKLKGQAAQSN
jgi:peptidoglycan pentaglycine glycine transferase (the first glycine)